MIRRLLILTLVGWMIMGCPEAYSQADRHTETDWKNIDPGSMQESDFVVLGSGEKVFGEVLRNYNKTFYTEIQFQSAEGVKTYLPTDLIGFGLENGQLFQSRRLPGEEQLSFVQILVSGPLELSEYRGALYFDDGETYQKLDSYHRDINREDQIVRKLYKPYIFAIKSALRGDCAVMLYPKVDRLSYNQDAIVGFLEDYYVCQGVAYVVHVERMRMLRISPLVGVGATYFSLGTPTKHQARKDLLENNVGYHGFVGVKIHDFKFVPRLSMDLRLAYSIFSTTVLSSYDASVFQWTGSEEVKESSFYLPFSVSYSVLKFPSSDLYLGISAGYWFGSLETSGGMTDLRIVQTSETFIQENAMTEIVGSKFVPGLKVGYRFSLTDKLKLLTEVEANSQKAYYRFNLAREYDQTPLRNWSEYSRSRLSFQIGLEF